MQIFIFKKNASHKTLLILWVPWRLKSFLNVFVFSANPNFQLVYKNVNLSPICVYIVV